MQSDTWRILKSGWGVILLVSLVLAIVIDITGLAGEPAGGLRRTLLGTGSAIAGWILCVVILKSAMGA
jgi:hypothetical protein